MRVWQPNTPRLLRLFMSIGPFGNGSVIMAMWHAGIALCPSLTGIRAEKVHYCEGRPALSLWIGYFPIEQSYPDLWCGKSLVTRLTIFYI